MNLFKQNNHAQFAACIAMIAVVVSIGCHYFYDQVGEKKRIPSPISREMPYELNGKIYRVWRGNELQIKSDLHTTYLLLQGVDNPDRDAATERSAIDFVHSLIESEQIRAVVVAFDERKRSIAQIYSGETNINFEIIKSGWGRFDGTQFDQSDRYRAAEEEAKAKKLGMWGV